MMRTVFSGILLVLVGLKPASAIGVSPDNFRIDEATDLVALCGVNTEDPLYTAAIHMCMGYLIGVHQMHTATTRIYCLPTKNPPTRDEAAAAFIAYVAANPEIAHKKALDAVLKWARHAYPCR